MDYKESIKDFCKGIGIDALGFCECRVFEELEPVFQNRKLKNIENEFEEENIEKRINPKLLFESGNTIISIAFPYLHSFEENKAVYFSKYTLGNDYHKVLSEYLKKVCQHIEKLGGEAVYFVDSNPLPERYIAYLSGVGFIGKNNMLITEKYGSYVFLGEVITNLKMDADRPIIQKCGQCNLCLTSCPTRSINVSGSIPNICLSYITQKKDIDDIWFSKFNGRLFGCDSCQMVCPYNEKVEKSTIKELKPYEHMENVSLEELIHIDNSIFKEKYRITSCGWRGKNILQRNALISLVKLKKDLNFELKLIKSPYILDYYNRLLKAFHL